MLGVSSRNAEMQRQIAQSREIAHTPYTVLIEGETGTGKELFARGIHEESARSGPFVPINCSAVPESMFEAELFGARRGAYTGLDADRSGLFSVAHGGTLFLDEVGDLPSPMQAKLLRVLEDGVVRPLGAGESNQVQVRVVAATHKPLIGLVEAGLFRRDLYFRLSQACIRLPPLRSRVEDLPVLIDQAVAEACELQGVPLRGVGLDARALLLEYDWPGNVRELKNVMAGAVLSCASETITKHDLPPRFVGQLDGRGATVEISVETPFFEALELFEREYLRSLLARADGNISEASRRSGLSRASIRSKARRYGLTGEPGDTTPRARVRFPSESDA